MKKSTKNILSIVLAIIMIVSTIPVAFATGEAYDKVTLGVVETVTLTEETTSVYVEFTPTESGEYVVASDNGDDYSIDPYVYVYDSEFGKIASNDDGDVGYNFECVFYAEAGETYYIELTTYNEGDCEYDYWVDKYIVISHQPTAAEPYVEINWDTDVDYQWCSVEGDFVEVTDKNANTVSNYEGDPSVYDEETGWAGNHWNETGASFFSIELSEGEVLLADFGEACDYEIGIWDIEFDDGIYNYGTESDGTIAFVAPWDGCFELYAYGINTDTRVKAYVGNYDVIAIEDETTATLQNPEFGSVYICVAELEEYVLTSDVFEYVYAITHQPTENEPFVDVNFDTDTKYQWFEVIFDEEEITNENATGRTANDDDAPATYDEADGWTGAPYGDGEVNFFKVDLEEGDTITMQISEDVEQFGIWSDNYNYEDFYDVSAGELCEFTAYGNDTYNVWALCSDDAKVRAYFGTAEYNKIDGETKEFLKKHDAYKLYVCEVTFKDGTTEMSDMFKTTKVKNGWQLEGNKWAYYNSGIKATNTWKTDSAGWCYLGEDGYCVTNAWKADSKGWCYLDANGRMVYNNWVYDGGKWYFIDSNGYMVSNTWKKDSKGWCYLGSSGAMLTNSWVKDSVGWCYVGANGYCVTNKWVKDSKGWCYLDSNGRMVYNKWVRDSKGWCYVGSSGYMVTNQWVKDGGKWYYLDANGYMVTGTKVINGKTYKFNSNGVWIG